jgi:hypothetical protein
MTPELADAYLRVLHVREASYDSSLHGYTLSWWEAADKARVPKQHRDTAISLLVAGYCDSYEEAMRDASPLMKTRERTRNANSNRRYGG